MISFMVRSCDVDVDVLCAFLFPPPPLFLEKAMLGLCLQLDAVC